MPQLAAYVAKILVSWGVGAKAAAVIANILVFVATTAASSFVSNKLAKGQDLDIAGRSITKIGSINPQIKIYGEALVGGTLAYINTANVKNIDLWSVHVLAGHECESISDVYLDHRRIANADINGGAAGGGDVAGSGFYQKVRALTVVRLTKHLGTSTQTVDTALDAAFSDWTTAHRLRGYTYGVATFSLYDKTRVVWEAGEPRNVKWLTRGAIIYDPRLDASPGAAPDNLSFFAWSDNPALCWADFMRDVKFSPLQGGVPPERIDWDAVVTAADVCDVLVAVPIASTEKRFTCNGTVSGNVEAEVNLAGLLSSMNGSMSLIGGEYVIYAGAYQAPTDSITADDVAGPLGFKSAFESDARVNTIKATYVDRDESYQPAETTPLSFAAHITRDGGFVIDEGVQLPFTDHWFEAQRVVRKQLLEADQQLTITLKCNLRAARLVSGQRVNVNIPEFAWSPKIFKVLGWSFRDLGDDDPADEGEPRLGIELALKEDASNAYADPLEGDYVTKSLAGAITLPAAVEIPGVDSIPRGINYGEGAWNINTFRNQTAAGGPNDGEIRITAGKFILPDGTTRTLSADVQVNTPWEGAIRPDDLTFYVVWGATNPDTRFAAGSWGDANAEAAGLFPMFYDRSRDQLYAIDNSNNEFLFTALATDFVIARGHKSSLSGGIDALTAVVAFVEEPQADVTSDNTAAAINGQGDLATQNTADFATDVTGAQKPDNNADVTGANTAAAIAGQGDLATQNTADFDTDVTGAEKPDDNATVGAVAGTNFTADYEAGTTITISANTQRGTTGTTKIMRKEYQLNGIGTFDFEFDVNTSGSPGVDRGDVEIRQGTTVLTNGTGGYLTGGAWTNNVSLNGVVLLNATDPVEVWLWADAGISINIRNCDIKLNNTNGESVTLN